MSSRLTEIVRESLQLPEEFELMESHGPGTLDAWDSLGHAALISALEKEFSLSLTMTEILEIESMADLRHLLIKHRICDD